MSTFLRTTLLATALASALVVLSGCEKNEAPAPVAEPARLSAPTDGNTQSWKLYMAGVAKQHMEGIRTSPFFYTLPPESAEDFDAQYERQLDNVTGTVSRGVLPGTMLAFGSLSPDSARIADLAVEAFAEAPPASMKDVKVLFIGQRAHADRVREAVEPSGATFVFADIAQ